MFLDPALRVQMSASACIRRTDVGGVPACRAVTLSRKVNAAVCNGIAVAGMLRPFFALWRNTA